MQYSIRHNLLGRGCTVGWIFTILEVVNHEIEKRRDPDAEPNPLMPEPKRVMEALGLTGLKDVIAAALMMACCSKLT